ncbi:MFS transporter [Sporomusa termitida]|uniref:MFS transporter n=1 Tax=Sporomusa termitida TaxID=2377 RepID=UPI00147940EE|nr:MFS transporter [Sporomusa termitida]
MTIGPAAGVFIGVQWGFPILFNLAGLWALLGLVLAYSIRYRPVQAAGPRGSLIEPAALPFAAISFCCTTIYGGIVAFMTLYALERGISNPGVYFSVFAVAVIVVRPIAGMLYDRLGLRVVMVPGLLLVTLSMLILGLSHHPALFLVSGIFMGLGFGATQPTLQAMAITVVDPQRRGTATATLTLGADFGIGTGAMLLGLIAQTVGYATMYLYSTAGGIIALILYIWYEYHTAGSDESGVRVDSQ